MMTTLKGLLLGVGLSFAGTLVYVACWVRFLLQNTPPHPSGAIGIDVVSFGRKFVIQSPRYWLMVLVLMAVGCAIIYFLHQATA
jgi:hypothetical protein